MRIKISVENLKFYISQKGMLRDYAHFLYLKSMVYRKKSCYYSYSPDKLAKDINCSRNKAISLLKRFIKRGWVRKHPGKNGTTNLTFIHTNKFADHRKGLLKNFIIEGDIKNIITHLQLFILKHKQSQFNRIKKVGHDINTACSSVAYKRATKTVTKLGLSANNLPNQNAKFKISISTIANWLHCSVGKASQLIKLLANKGLIKVYRSKQLLCQTTNGKIATAFLDKYKNSYYTGKYVTLVSCNEYEF